MKGWAFIFAMVAACSSGSPEPPPTLVGNWLYTAAQGQSGIGLTFTAEGTYSLSGIVLVSSTAAQAKVETGTYTSDATTITLTPKESSCPGPDPVEVDHYQFNGGALMLTSPSGVLVLQANTATASRSFAIQTGCPDRQGNFTPAPLKPVAN